MATIRTRLHLYNFLSAKHPAYKAMCEAINANADGRGVWMNTWGGDTAKGGDKFYCGKTNEVVTVDVELDTAHVFGNQWNEAGEGGRRLFDWYEEYQPNRNPDLKRGHWLEVTPEMAETRRLTLKCRYCGHQYGPHHDPLPNPLPGPGLALFCNRCLDSEYLKPDDLPLLRLSSVADQEADRKHTVQPLEGEERERLMARYVERQTTGTDSRAKRRRDKQRADVVSKYEKETAAALAERDGMLWLWDNGVSLDNVIYYPHTGKFSFGWRSEVAPEVESKLLDILCEFPFPYEIKAQKKRAATTA
jgi:hypothetical protein